MNGTKYVLVIGDGMADLAMPQLGGKTALMAAKTPIMDALARQARVGLCRTVPQGLPPGSDTAILSIFGCDPRKYYTGRSPLEAAGIGVFLEEGEISLRMNLVSLRGDSVEGGVMLSHSGGGVEGEEALSLANFLINDEGFARAAAAVKMRVTATDTFRHIAVMKGVADCDLTPPHDILERQVREFLPKGEHSEKLTRLMKASFAALSRHDVNLSRISRGLLPANCAWFWGAGTAVSLPSFAARYGTRGTVASAVPLVRGIARLCGLEAPEIDGANGEIDTNYKGKLDAALGGLNRCDFAALHVEAPDECGHAGDLAAKIRAIETLDERLLSPLIESLNNKYPSFRLLLLPDHPTPVSTRTHSGDAVPFLLYDSEAKTGNDLLLNEESAESGEFVEDGTRLMDMLFAK